MQRRLYFRLKDRLRKYFIFGNIFKPIRKNRLNLFYWEYMFSKNNVGDFLSSVIYKYITDDLGLNRDKKFSKTKKLSIIGSVIQILHQGTTVWGSGSLSGQLEDGLTFDVRAVRGPETYSLLKRKDLECPMIYGDPAILLSLFYKPQVAEDKFPYLIIPHHRKVEKYVEKYGEDVVLSPLTNDWKDFINKIASSKLIISSSLHGIVLAESYSVPAIFLTDVEWNLIFKYNDYYYSTNRFVYKKASSVEEALSLGAEKLPENLDILRKGLCMSFPIDLFEDTQIKSMNDIHSGVIKDFLESQ